MKTKTRFAFLTAAIFATLHTLQPDSDHFLFAAEKDTVVTKEVTEIWNESYGKARGFLFGTRPLRFLKENISALREGRALVLAMGEGRNAIYLAQRGYVVEGIDISAAAVDKARALADKKGVHIEATTADLTKYKIKSNHYDLITCFYYLQRDIIPQIIEGLRQGGMVIFETYTVDQLQLEDGPRNKDYLLNHNELLDYFRELRVILYEEKVINNSKAIARIIAEKP